MVFGSFGRAQRRFYRRRFRFRLSGVSVSPRLVFGPAFCGSVGDAAAGGPAAGEVAAALGVTSGASAGNSASHLYWETDPL